MPATCDVAYVNGLGALTPAGDEGRTGRTRGKPNFDGLGGDPPEALDRATPLKSDGNATYDGAITREAERLPIDRTAIRENCLVVEIIIVV